ncbi:MAG TPA: hypothetical protein VFS40_02020 [Gemmatimonadales bacterium]|nr:hypothetical protein [Gemmatimonadales bacterium]
MTAMLRRRPLAAHLAALLAACCVGAAAPRAAHAQFFQFGQNKIQYRTFDWRILHGRHVDLYYYPAEAELAPAALAIAEASYDTLALQFGHQVRTRIPVIIYASHVDFEQTNLLPFTPPEELLGSTDFLKRRVTLPFGGNFTDFRHTMRHEMVHAFQLSLESEAYYQTLRGTRVSLPLWWTEGLAELWSGGEDARDEMILRDLTLTGKLPPIQQLAYYTGGLVYPLGGRIHRWLADTYGDWRVATLYKEITRYDSFDSAIRAVYGKPLAQLNEEFQLYMRRKYYPVAEDRAPLPVLAQQVAPMAIKPVWVPPDSAGGAGSAIYASPASGYLTVYEKSLAPGGRPRGLVTGGKSAELESFHPFASRLDASRSPLLLFSARYGDRDALVVWHARKRKVVGRYQFPGLVSILSPAWMPDGRAIVFSGLSESGVSDLYRLDLPGGRLTDLTNDRYQDLDPSPSPDGSRLVFSSDRTSHGPDGAKNLFVLDLRTGAVRQLTDGNWEDETPVWTKDERIWFSSSRDGVLNVFSVDTTGAGRRETSAWTGAFDPAPMPEGQGLLVGGFHDLSWQVYRYPVDSAARADTSDHFLAAQPAAPAGEWRWPAPADTAGTTAVASAQRYRRRYTLDFAAGDVAAVPGYGGVQGAAFLLSDMLGDNLIYGSIASFQGRSVGGLLDNLNVTGIYLNRAHRLNWGVGGFRARGYAYEGELFAAYREQSVGGIGLLQYPLDRFNRLEGTLVMEHSDRRELLTTVTAPDDTIRVGWIASNYASFVHDNTLWVPAGPIDGQRYSVTAGLSSDFSNGRFDSFLFSGDWRRYFRLGSEAAWAMRAFGYWSGGNRPRRLNIGGTLGLRGYPYYGYILGTRAWMVNQELRFPLLRHLTFGTPLGDVRFPGIQGAIFGDLGRAWTRNTTGRALLGSYGASFRLPVAPLAVFRLDVGRRFASKDFQGYSLDADQTKGTFVTFFFGYNY